jgi:hypothetical protein
MSNKCDAHIDHENRIEKLEEGSEKMDTKIDSNKTLLVATLATTVVGLLIAIVNLLGKMGT